MERKKREALIDDVTDNVVKQLLRKRKFKKMVRDAVEAAVDDVLESKGDDSEVDME